MKLNLTLTNEDGNIISSYVVEVNTQQAQKLTIETLLLWVKNGMNYKSTEEVEK